MIRINEWVSIPEDELSYRFSPSSKPGGQRRDKASTRVTLLFDVNRSDSLSDAERIRKGAARGLTDGTVLKPDQAGTVTAFLDAVDVAYTSGQTVIASHRSISTESVFLSTATVERHIELMKIGPLKSDYSSVLRLNELIRAAERRRS